MPANSGTEYNCVMRHVGLTTIAQSVRDSQTVTQPGLMASPALPLSSCVSRVTMALEFIFSAPLVLRSSSRPSQLPSSFSAPLVLLSSSRPSQLPSSSALLVLLSSALILFFSTLTVLVSALSSSCSFFSLSPHPRTMFDGSLPTRAPCLMALFPPVRHV